MTGAATSSGPRSREAVEIAVSHLDSGFRIRWINRRGTEIARQSVEQLLGRPIWQIWPELIGSAAESLLRTSMATQTPASLTHRHATIRGARWLNLRSVPRPAGGLAIFVRDITEAKRAEAALAEGNQRLSAIVAHASVGLSEISLDGQFLQVNEELCRLLGQEEERLLRLGVAEVTCPEDLPATLQVFAGVVQTGRPASVNKRYVRPDGSLVWANSSLTRLDDPNGRPRAVLAVTADLTERRQVEAHLIESEARVRTLAEGIPQLVWRADLAGQAIWVSPQWIAQTGISQVESLGPGWLAAIHPDDRPATFAAWWTAENLGVFAVEHRIVTAHNGYRWCQSRAVRRFDPASGSSEWLGTSTDIEDQIRLRKDLARARDEMESLVAERTAELRMALQALRDEVKERERAEEALRHTQKLDAIGQLTGGIAHDFNNMLQGIMGSLDLAQRRIQQGRAAEVPRFLDAARDASQRAAALTRRLLAFARRQRLDPRPLDPNLLISDLQELIRGTMGPAITLDLRMLAAEGNHVLCDPSELENVLLNLCINARDAMPQGGRLVLGTMMRQLKQDDLGAQEAAQPGDYLEISITDTGSGMPPQLIERAFEPFFTTKPQGQGTGLGLSQVYGFVRQSGGLVRIESRVGQGTTVRLWLPRQASQPGQDGVSDCTPLRAPAQPGLVVLLVDDEASVRMPAAERLRELGYLVVEAQDGDSALRQAGSLARIDLLVTDVGLPGGMNGRQVAERVSEGWPGLPVLFITGYSGTVLPVGVEVLGKPFELDALARRVQTILTSP